MTCSHCVVTDRQFDPTIARADLKRFRRRGADAATRKLVAAVQAAELPREATLLDIGGGIGAIHHHLLDRGFARAEHVDASAAYIAAAKGEAERLGHGKRVTFRHADVRAVADELALADVVTLDRVVCCDPDYAGLLRAAADHARKLLAFSYPRRNWLSRAIAECGNRWRALWRDPFRSYIHAPAAMAAVVERAGLQRRWQGGTPLWVVVVFERSARRRPISSKTPLSAF